jgi:hypothetical protein
VSPRVRRAKYYSSDAPKIFDFLAGGRAQQNATTGWLTGRVTFVPQHSVAICNEPVLLRSTTDLLIKTTLK